MIAKSSPADLATVRKEIELNLQLHFQNRKAMAGSIHDRYHKLWQSIETTALAGGKRLRPYLCTVSYDAFGGKEPAVAIEIGTAIELLHIAMLIHDDIIDRDFIRHDTLNISGIYQKEYMQLTDKRSVEHYADSASLIAGDLLIADAFQMIHSPQLSLALKSELSANFHRAIFEVSGGELLDLEAPLLHPGTIDALTVARYKTSFYSFSLPLIAGAVAAGAPKETFTDLERLGMHIGIAFQLVDDLIGVFGDSSETGKSVTSDIRETKQTYLLQRTYAQANDAQKGELDSLLTKGISDKGIERVKELMQETGAKKDTEILISQCAELASDKIAMLPITTDHTSVLHDFLRHMTQRSS